MTDGIKFIGLDVHKASISVAVAEEHGGVVSSLGAIAHTADAIARLVKKLGPPEQLRCCYEAGPTGYGLYRQLHGLGVHCLVAAPSLIPVQSGNRVKTDRRDAVKLARLLRSGDLTAAWVPDPEHEALRDLVRAREQAVRDLHRARQRVTKYLLRLGLHRPERMAAWGKRHREWLGEVHLSLPAQRLVLGEYLVAVDQHTAQRDRLEAAVTSAAQNGPQAALVGALQALRGVGPVTAVTLVAEAGDLTRFDQASQAMSYAGLVSSEDSSGERHRRGAITKAGNSHLRFVLVEASWHYRHQPSVSRAMKQRQNGLPEEVLALASRAQVRLHQRFIHLALHKLPQVAVVAVARELMGWVWALAQLVSPALRTTPTQAVA